MTRRPEWASVLLLALALTLGACGGGGGSGDGGNGGGGLVVDNSYNFTAAGVQPGVSSRDPGRSRIIGALTRAVGGPAVGVTVTLRRLVPDSRQAVGSITTTSGEDGSYVFGNVEPGFYRVQVESQTQTATCTADQDTTVGFSGVLGGDGGNGGNPLPDARYKWTLIIVMNADNDLEQYGVDDINEMEQLPDSVDVRIVVLMDRTRGFDTSNNNWTDTRRFVIRHDNDTTVMTSAKSPAEGGQAEVLGELDTGDKVVVRDFIEWAMRNYPAQRYLVDLWNHGAGWRMRTAPFGRGVLFDDTQRTFVSTPELSEALDVPANIDIVAFDSSLMQMAEVAYQIRNRCTLVVGSEESPPGEGYPYQEIFSAVIANPDITPQAFARHIVNSTVDTLGERESVTQSALRSNKLAALLSAISGYGDALTGKLGTFRNEILAARNATQRYGSGSSLYEGYRDLIDFIDNVDARTNDPNLASAGQGVREALTAALVAERHSGSGLSRSHGLSIFIPNQGDWNDLRASYLETAFGADGRWDEFLDALHN